MHRPIGKIAAIPPRGLRHPLFIVSMTTCHNATGPSADRELRGRQSLSGAAVRRIYLSNEELTCATLVVRLYGLEGAVVTAQEVVDMTLL